MTEIQDAEALAERLTRKLMRTEDPSIVQGFQKSALYLIAVREGREKVGRVMKLTSEQMSNSDLSSR